MEVANGALDTSRRISRAALHLSVTTGVCRVRRAL